MFKSDHSPPQLKTSQWCPFLKLVRGWRAEFICRTCRSLWYKFSPLWQFQLTNVTSLNTQWKRDVHDQLLQASWWDSSTAWLPACSEQSTKSFYGPHGSAQPSLAAFPITPTPTPSLTALQPPPCLPTCQGCSHLRGLALAVPSASMFSQLFSSFHG